MTADQREVERVVILGGLQAEIMMFEPMLIKEISRSGATVDTRFPLHLNSLHDLRLTLGPTSVILKGRVVHSRISDVDQDVVTYRTGLEFVEPSERVADVIAQFLDEVKTNRSIGAK
jgi:PilZ domain